MSNYFMGLDGFIWFIGVVEDRNDPSKLGRVKVRCLGFHTEDKNDIPTADLPWAHVMHPVTDPSMQGMGSTPSFLVEGSWVVGFFRDADEKQQPIIMGSLPGYPQEVSNTNIGFNDPKGKYPQKENIQSGHALNESDVNRLARVDKDKPSLICTSSGGNGKNFIEGFRIQLNYLGSRVFGESLIQTKSKEIQKEEFRSILDSFCKNI